jgi:ABC-type sugar transport system ATPase subunit
VIAVEFRGVQKEYHGKPTLTGVDLAIESGTFAVIFGSPGCGKSVSMRLLTGLEKPTAGKILLRGADVTRISPGERNIGYVPQMFALYPHYKVYDNIAYPLNLMGMPHREIDPIVRQAADLLRITKLLGKRPDQLSGGEKQRVAIARGIVKKTDIYVLDDPLTGLDFKLREQLFDDLKDMQATLKSTFVYTTSDPLEALILAEQIHVMDGGRVVESGTTEEVYRSPQHVRTMALLGFPAANLVSGLLYDKSGQTWCKTPVFNFPARLLHPGPSAGEQRVSVAMRPQAVKVNPEKTDGLLSSRAQVTLQEDLGGELVVHLNAAGTPLVAVVRHDEAHLLSNTSETIGVPSSELVLYAADNGRRLGQGA